MPVRSLLLLATVSVALACAASGTSNRTGSRNLLTSEEIREVEAGSPTLAQVIQRLRPWWMRSRARTISGDEVVPIVYLDGTRFGELDTLSSIQAQDVGEVRFMSASDATTRYGTGHAGGVISVRSRRGGGGEDPS